MIPSNKKIERMIQISRLYYEEDMTQHMIAQKLGISRPLVSQLLTEAKSCGIVSIRISEVENREALLRHQLLERFGLSCAVVVPDDSSHEETDRAVAAAAYQFCFQPDSAGTNIGIGCGPLPGMMADIADTMPSRPQHEGHLFPLIGGVMGPTRGCHTNELVRVLAGKGGFYGDYLYAPAVLDSEEELELSRKLGPNQTVIRDWDHMDMAIVNITNFPSSNYAATAFQDMPEQSQPAGQIMGHCYSAQGAQIPLRVNNIFQATMGQLRRAKRVVALCSSCLEPEAVEGALGLDLVHTLVLPVSLAHRLLNS